MLRHILERYLTALTITLILLSVRFPTAAQELQRRDTTTDGRLAPLLASLGTLHMPVTTKHGDAQKYFDQGIRLIYGFNHAEALRSFREAARIDKDCAIAYWGQALALAPNINDSAIGPDREQQGYDAIRDALKRRRQANPKERALIDALASRFAAKPPSGDRQAMNQAYARAMDKVWRRFPKDPDVAVLYADAVMNTRPWNYWTKDGKPQPGVEKARMALESTIQAFPDHPGALHLYIHLLEASDHVDQAVPSADRLGPLMPGAGHLVHMPSHIYIRVGRYRDAVEANIKAIKADEDYITQCRAQGIYPAAYYPHNIHFLAMALVMEGRREEALQAVRKAASQHDHDVPKGLLGFANLLEALSAIVMVRFGQWQDILNSPEPAGGQPFVSAMHHFARGMAFSAAGRTAEARAEAASLERLAGDPALRDQARIRRGRSRPTSERLAGDPALKDQKVLDLNSLADIAQIAVAMLRGDMAQKAGQFDEAIAAFRRAVEIEDGLLYSEPPDWFIPPRQYLADAYLAAGKLTEAERVYREDLKRHRANGWSLRGLEQTLRKQGKTAEAERIRAEFERAWQRADIKLAASRF
jgi:tetratricopeptide (TPR) repeat protein